MSYLYTVRIDLYYYWFFPLVRSDKETLLNTMNRGSKKNCLVSEHQSTPLNLTQFFFKGIHDLNTVS
jgi:hypothetical protein